MKERVLELLEELVGSHTLSQKRSKADEIAAIVNTAVFLADQFEGDPSGEAHSETISLGPVSAEVVNAGLHLVGALGAAEAANQQAAQQQAGDPAAENSALSTLANESPLILSNAIDE